MPSLSWLQFRSKEQNVDWTNITDSETFEKELRIALAFRKAKHSGAAHNRPCVQSDNVQMTPRFRWKSEDVARPSSPKTTSDLAYFGRSLMSSSVFASRRSMVTSRSASVECAFSSALDSLEWKKARSRGPALFSKPATHSFSCGLSWSMSKKVMCAG